MRIAYYTILLATVDFIANGNAQSGCPNACSGHGDCGEDDVCICYKGYKGGDCSYRQCAYGLSWSVTSAELINDDRFSESIKERSPGASSAQDIIDGKIPTDIVGATVGLREYAECSNRGICDSSTGICKCFKGYTGKGCRRTKCPNDCSGHGRCILTKDYSDSFKSPISYNSGYWDQDKTQWCVCDRGYGGYDCSERSCPLGDDPSTTCAEASSEDVQLVYIQSTPGASAKEFFTLEFTDRFGGTFTTHPIDYSLCKPGKSCHKLQEGLATLPNFAIPNVEADEISLASVDTTVGQHAFLVKFTDKANAGKQNTLKCNAIFDPLVDGAAPMYKKVPHCTVVHVGEPEWSQSSTGQVYLNGKGYFYDQIYTENADPKVSRCNALKKDCHLKGSISGGATTSLGQATSLDGCLALVAKSNLVYTATGVTYVGGDCSAHVGGTYTSSVAGGNSCQLAPSTCAQVYEEYVPCSNKGLCDKNSGNCKCLSGASGLACNEQNTFA